MTKSVPDLMRSARRSTTEISVCSSAWTNTSGDVWGVCRMAGVMVVAGAVAVAR